MPRPFKKNTRHGYAKHKRKRYQGATKEERGDARRLLQMKQGRSDKKAS